MPCDLPPECNIHAVLRPDSGRRKDDAAQHSHNAFTHVRKGSFIFGKGTYQYKYTKGTRDFHDTRLFEYVDEARILVVIAAEPSLEENVEAEPA
jgi:hypothetical protein